MTPDNIHIRKATENDIPILLAFEQGVIETERPFNSSLKEGKINYYDIPYLITDNKTELLVAETNGKLIACGYARIEQSKPYIRHRAHAYLGFMFVEKDYRGKRINQLILDSLVEWVRSQGVYELILEVYSQNRAAIRAYEKSGFETYKLEMRLSLET